MHCNWFTVEAVLKFGMAHDVHLAPQAMTRCQQMKDFQKKKILTIALMFIIIGDHPVRSLTNPITVRTDTVPIKQILSSRADNAIIRCCPGARQARRRALLASRAIPKAAIRTNSVGRRYTWHRVTLRLIIRVLSEPVFASNAHPRTIGALRAAYLANLAVPRRREEEPWRALCARSAVGRSGPSRVTRTLSCGPTLTVKAVARGGCVGREDGDETPAGTCNALVARWASCWACLTLWTKESLSASFAGGAGEAGGAAARS